MKIIKADVLGYCMGVKRAVDSAWKALEQNREHKVYTLGPLIHNPSVLKSLEQNGLIVLKENSLQNLSPLSTVIIRAHGTTPDVIESLKEKNVNIVDATCPKVLLSQKRAAEWAAKGYQIVIAGDRNHGEVTSISGYSRGSSVVIQNVQEAQSLEIREKAVFISQTTFSAPLFSQMEQILKEKNPSLVVFNSICSATNERQNALKKLKGKADCIIVLGGKNSANTRRLYESAATICSYAVLIESAAEIPSEVFGMKTVAITAGASTPDSLIDEVEEILVKNSSGI